MLFSLAEAETIASTHCAYPWTAGQAELTCMTDINTEVNASALPSHCTTGSTMPCSLTPFREETGEETEREMRGRL